MLHIKSYAKLFQKHLWIVQWFIQMEVNKNQLSHENCLIYQMNDIWIILKFQLQWANDAKT